MNEMNNGSRVPRFTLLLLATMILALAPGCASTERGKETRVSVADLSGPARATVERATAGGQVDKIDKEIEKGKVVYDVEATVGGKHVEFLIGDADGAILGTETSIDYGELPQPVRLTAEKYFDNIAKLKAMKGIEYGKVHYEIEGPKNGKSVEVTFDPDGRRVP